MSKLSTKICVKSPAKINLHLEIIGKREDGYHELAMIMQNIDLSDYIEFENNQIGEIKLKSDCKDLCLNEDNLIIKAANYIKGTSKNKELGANIFLKRAKHVGPDPLIENERQFCKFERRFNAVSYTHLTLPTTPYV